MIVQTKMRRESRVYRSIELFSGAGGMAFGTALAGFQHLALIEQNRNACETLRLNSGTRPETRDWSVIAGDVCQVNYSCFQDEVDLLAGGPPCQAFSLGGKHSGQADKRNMFPEIFRAMRALHPRAVMLENVKGLLRATFRPYFDYLLRQLEYPSIEPRVNEDWIEHDARLQREAQDGLPPEYNVRYQLINCADFGIPQRRERVFIVAFRADQGLFWQTLKPTHSSHALEHSKCVTGEYWEEHNLQLPKDLKMQRNIFSFNVGPGETVKRWRTVRDAFSQPVPLPEPIDFKEAPSFDQHFGNPGARAYPGHTGSPLDFPSKTLKAGDHGVPGGENMLVREDGSVRYFSVREAARLQTFPDTYRFAGAWVECFRQLGNAVPVEIAHMIASGIVKQFESVEVSVVAH
jgi:DNA (cytosine-5)-methyltransferase 1